MKIEGSSDAQALLEKLETAIAVRSEIKPGDVVQLNSGGPFMSVGRVLPDNGEPRQCRCHWHGDDKQAHAAVFDIDALHLVSVAEVDLARVAAAVWEGPRADGKDGGCFDYVGDDEHHRKVREFAAALSAIDGVTRNWQEGD